MALWYVKVNLCQNLLFLHQLTHNLTRDCSLIYQFLHKNQKLRTWGEHILHKNCFLFLFWHSEQFLHKTCSPPCSELVVFMYWTGKSMNNHLSYCGLVDPVLLTKIYLYRNTFNLYMQRHASIDASHLH